MELQESSFFLIFFLASDESVSVTAKEFDIFHSSECLISVAQYVQTLEILAEPV